MKQRIYKVCSLAMVVVLCISLFTSMASASVIIKTGQVGLPELNFICDNCNNNPFDDHEYKVVEDKSVKRWRIKDMTVGAWYVDAKGDYAYTPAVGDVPTDGPGTAPAEDIAPPSISNNKFIDARAVKWSPRAISSYDALGTLVTTLGKEGINATLAKNKIPKNDGSGKNIEVWYVANAAKTAVYCNSKGMPYTASVESGAVDNDYNYIIDNSDNSTNTTVDNKVIDTSNNTMTIINENGDKVTLNIDSLYWDDSTHSYTANTYNIQNNTYNYYTYNITYNITNTYITYIGSNGAYQQEEYKYYYELPDGRSSEDLTAEEVGAMSFQFADVTNYARSATDTSLRALYHFDGNTEDSGYFSTQTKFKWDSGASISYMDSANFNGALYLDELAHGFDIDLPSNLPSTSDFSIQWRHYQASQPDTLSNVNNAFSIGGVTLLRWDERSFYWNGSSTPTVSVPVGSWHELALIRNSGTLYFYINGVKVASKADTTGYQGKLMFSLGTTSRAYTMLDELRVVNFAVAKAGASYQCTTVPYDTNLVLVLPDSAFPIADEYWDFNSKGNLFARYDFSTGDTVLPATWQSQSVSLLYNAGSVSFTPTYYESDYNYRRDGNASYTKYGVYYPLSYMCYSPTGAGTAYPAGQYTFSILTASGETCSLTFTLDYWNNGGQYNARVGSAGGKEFEWGSLVAYYYGGNRTLQGFGILPKPGKSVEILYAELVKGPTPNTGHKKVSCIYSSEDIKPNTAAVQSAIPVNGYTVGGVRPTFPVRGDVWFPVEGRRITGCYQYDGSMWRTAGCRYYTGTRWIPIYAFDIYTLADCWDIADGGEVDSSPPITTETGFWNWFKKEWNDFRKWGNTSVELIIKAIVASGGAPTEECTKHEYRYKDIKSPTCTAKGSRLFTCTKCGDTYTEDVDSLGHDWLQIDDIQDTTDESGETVKGYALWECSRCKLQHKDYDRTGPPPAEGESTITELITNLFDKLGGLVGSVVDWLLELGTEAVDGLGDIGDYFKLKSEEVGGFGGQFLSLLSGFFDIIPPELMTCMSLAIVFLALGLFVKKVLLK